MWDSFLTEYLIQQKAASGRPSLANNLRIQNYSVLAARYFTYFLIRQKKLHLAMERFCESVLALTGSLGLLLTTDGRLLVMLSLTNLSDNASSRALPLESPQSTFQGFILTNTDLRHLVSLPSAQSFDDPLRQTRRQWSTVRLIIAQQTIFVNLIFHFL